VPAALDPVRGMSISDTHDDAQVSVRGSGWQRQEDGQADQHHGGRLQAVDLGMIHRSSVPRSPGVRARDSHTGEMG